MFLLSSVTYSFWVLIGPILVVLPVVQYPVFEKCTRNSIFWLGLFVLKIVATSQLLKHNRLFFQFILFISSFGVYVKSRNSFRSICVCRIILGQSSRPFYSRVGQSVRHFARNTPVTSSNDVSTALSTASWLDSAPQLKLGALQWRVSFRSQTKKHCLIIFRHHHMVATIKFSRCRWTILKRRWRNLGKNQKTKMTRMKIF